MIVALEDTTTETLFFDLTIVGLATTKATSFTAVTLDFGVDTCFEVCWSTSDVVLVPAIDLPYDAMIDELVRTVTGSEPDIGVDVLADVAANKYEATMMSLCFISFLAPCELMLLLGWEACCCRPITASDRCALQARMPSYHV